MSRLLGIIGGLSPYSTILYYKDIVELYKEKTGEYPEILIASVTIQRVCKMVREKRLDDLAEYLSQAAKRLESGGAEGFLIAANTPHVVADRVAGSVGIEFLSILDSVYREIRRLGVKRVGILATKETVEFRLYQDYLEKRGIETVVPSESGLEKIERVVEAIIDGFMSPTQKLALSSVANTLILHGAEALVLACTELPLAFKGIRVRVPVIDSERVHVRDAVEFILGEKIGKT